MSLSLRNPDLDYVNPEKEVYIGLWCLQAGATLFLSARLWAKLTRRHGLWWDDYILLLTWIVLTINDIMITVQWATGYVTPVWDLRQHVLIDISSCLTLLGQSLSKTAFAVTLLKLTKGERWQQWVLWFIIITMNLYNLIKILFEWSRACGVKKDFDLVRLDFCLHDDFLDNFKKGGNIYNIIMDFVLAAYPWMITWNLSIKTSEKIGLCVVMSLGMVVAIESAIRTDWKFKGNPKDELYFWRLGMSAIWYSSEVAGTIIVQCVPVLRTLIVEVSTTLQSRRLPSTADDFELHGSEHHLYHAK